MIAFLIGTIAFAQAPVQSSPQPAVQYAKTTLVDFLEANINASVTGPEIRFVQEWTPARSGSLIRLRSSFQTEINHSVSSIQ